MFSPSKVSCYTVYSTHHTPPSTLSLLSHLIHDHLLGSSASLASFNDGLKKLEVLDVPALLYAVNEVLDL